MFTPNRITSTSSNALSQGPYPISLSPNDSDLDSILVRYRLLDCQANRSESVRFLRRYVSAILYSQETSQNDIKAELISELGKIEFHDYSDYRSISAQHARNALGLAEDYFLKALQILLPHGKLSAASLEGNTLSAEIQLNLQKVLIEKSTFDKSCKIDPSVVFSSLDKILDIYKLHAPLEINLRARAIYQYSEIAERLKNPELQLIKIQELLNLNGAKDRIDLLNRQFNALGEIPRLLAQRDPDKISSTITIGQSCCDLARQALGGSLPEVKLLESEVRFLEMRAKTPLTYYLPHQTKTVATSANARIYCEANICELIRGSLANEPKLCYLAELTTLSLFDAESGNDCKLKLENLSKELRALDNFSVYESGLYLPSLVRAFVLAEFFNNLLEITSKQDLVYFGIPQALARAFNLSAKGQESAPVNFSKLLELYLLDHPDSGIRKALSRTIRDVQEHYRSITIDEKKG